MYVCVCICDLNKEHITGADYTLGKRFCIDFEIKNLGDLYVQGNTLFLADVF